MRKNKTNALKIALFVFLGITIVGITASLFRGLRNENKTSGGSTNVHKHDYEVISSVPGTCTTPGSETVKCKTCLHKETRETAAVGHILDENNSCSVCGTSFTILTYELSSDGTYYKVIGSSEAFNDEHITYVPSSYNGLPVKEVYLAGAAVQLVYVSEGITTLTEQAFYGCSSLKYLYLPSTISEVKSSDIFDGITDCKVYLNSETMPDCFANVNNLNTDSVEFCLHRGEDGDLENAPTLETLGNYWFGRYDYSNSSEGNEKTWLYYYSKGYLHPDEYVCTIDFDCPSMQYSVDGGEYQNCSPSTYTGDGSVVKIKNNSSVDVRPFYVYDSDGSTVIASGTIKPGEHITVWLDRLNVTIQVNYS